MTRYLACLAVLPLVGVAYGGIITHSVGDSGAGALAVSAPGWAYNGTIGGVSDYTLQVSGVQSGTPAYLQGDFVANSDPNVTFIQAVENDMSYAWTEYKVAVGMDQNFTLSDASALIPGDWTAVITPVQGGLQLPNHPAGDLGYVGYIDFKGGTPVDVGDTLEFQYKTSFDGDVNFCTAQTPVPEPASMCFVALGGLAVVLRRRNRT